MRSNSECVWEKETLVGRSGRKEVGRAGIQMMVESGSSGFGSMVSSRTCIFCEKVVVRLYGSSAFAVAHSACCIGDNVWKRGPSELRVGLDSQWWPIRSGFCGDQSFGGCLLVNWMMKPLTCWWPLLWTISYLPTPAVLA